MLVKQPQVRQEVVDCLATAVCQLFAKYPRLKARLSKGGIVRTPVDDPHGVGCLYQRSSVCRVVLVDVRGLWMWRKGKDGAWWARLKRRGVGFGDLDLAAVERLTGQCSRKADSLTPGKLGKHMTATHMGSSASSTWHLPTLLPPAGPIDKVGP